VNDGTLLTFARILLSISSRKIVGSISDGFIEILHWYIPWGRTMALGLTLPLIEMSTRNISWGKRRPVCRTDNLTTFRCRMLWNLGPQPPQTLGPLQVCNGIAFTAINIAKFIHITGRNWTYVLWNWEFI